jgi:hypothetical protein
VHRDHSGGNGKQTDLAGFGVWVIAPTSARVTPSMSQGIEPIELMKNAKGVATAEFYDHGFVFH